MGIGLNEYLGQIAVRQQQWPAAITHYQAEQDGLPGIRVHALLHITDAYRLSGQPDLARVNLNAALREDPENPEAARLQQVLDQTPN
jgi:predicted Zn-dependent protease